MELEISLSFRVNLNCVVFYVLQSLNYKFTFIYRIQLQWKTDFNKEFTDIISYIKSIYVFTERNMNNNK